jgi:hypothetical protein
MASTEQHPGISQVAGRLRELGATGEVRVLPIDVN